MAREFGNDEMMSGMEDVGATDLKEYIDEFKYLKKLVSQNGIIITIYHILNLFLMLCQSHSIIISP